MVHDLLVLFCLCVWLLFYLLNCLYLNPRVHSLLFFQFLLPSHRWGGSEQVLESSSGVKPSQIVVVVVGFLPINSTVAAFAAVTKISHLNQTLWFGIQEFPCPRRMLYTNRWNKTLLNSSQCCEKAGQSLCLCSWQPHQDTVNQWGVSMSYTMTAEQHASILQYLLSKETWCRDIYLSLQWQNGSLAVECTPIFQMSSER